VRQRLAAAEPTELEARLRDLDTKIERALDLAVEVGDLGTAKERLRTPRVERERVTGELARTRLDLPTAEELMPRLRERLRDLESTTSPTGANEMEIQGDAFLLAFAEPDAALRGAVKDPGSTPFGELRIVHLKGMSEPQRLSAVDWR